MLLKFPRDVLAPKPQLNVLVAVPAGSAEKKLEMRNALFAAFKFDKGQVFIIC